MREGGAGDDQLALSEQMIRYWTRFARTGDPNAADGVDPYWTAYSDDASSLLSLVAPQSEALSAESFGATHRCGLWIQ